MLRDRIQEILDFFRTESPYRSANKGWITDDIFLELGSDKGRDVNQLDQLVKVSFFWRPIIQLASFILIIIFLCTFLAFTPLALSKSRSISFTPSFDFISKSLSIQEDLDGLEVNDNKAINLPKTKTDSINQSFRNEDIEVIKTSNSSAYKSNPITKKVERTVIPSTKPIEANQEQKNLNNKKVITATDLFQSKRN